MSEYCIECELRREQIKNEKLETAKQQAKNYAKLQGLEKIVIYQRKNGSYSFCERGAEKESYTILEVLFVNAGN